MAPEARTAAGERARAAEIAALPAAARTALAARRPWTWADGARPRDLVAGAAAAARIDVAGLEQVPHDHLPAASLPPLPLSERLDLVLAHYDLRVTWAAAAGAAAAGRIVPLEAAAAGGGSGPRDRPDRARRPGPQPRAPERFTLRVGAMKSGGQPSCVLALDKALEALAPRLGLDPEIDRAALAARGILPGEIVRAAVTDASRDQVLDAIVGPLGLRWRIEGRRLVVDAPPP